MCSIFGNILNIKDMARLVKDYFCTLMCLNDALSTETRGECMYPFDYKLHPFNTQKYVGLYIVDAYNEADYLQRYFNL